jgi:DNA-binding response OmpR family regulator
MPGRLLLMDNEPSVLDKWGQVLEQDGYEVWRAATLEDAEEILNDKYLHLAILDIRMQDENDENDISGLLLAKKPEFRPIPKVILTAYPSWQYVREVMAPDTEGRAAAVNFVAKVEGPEALEAAIEKAFAEQIRTSWNLQINAREREGLSFLHLASLVQKGLPNDTLVQRAIELEDLFRRLFYDYAQIRMLRLLWRNDRRFCLSVLAQSLQGATDPLILVCGKQSQLEAELKQMQELAPETGQHTKLAGSAETVHFGAAAYVISEADPDTIRPLRSLAESGKKRPLKAAFEHLLGEVLEAWHQRGQKVEHRQDLIALYRQWVGLGKDGIPLDEVERRVDALVQKVRPLSTVGIDRGDQSLTFRFPLQGPMDCPDPVATIYNPRAQQDTPVVYRVSPGQLTADNVLVDSDQRTWLTDFAHADLAPQWWDFICLEAALRFDLGQAPDLLAWHEFEECLVKPSALHEHLREQDVVSDLQSNVSLIEQIRQQAGGQTGSDPLPYYAGLLVWAVGAMAQYTPGTLYTQGELMRGAHLLLAAAMIARHLDQLSELRDQMGSSGSAEIENEGGPVLSLDNDRVTVRIGSKQSVRLSGHELELFRCLYDQAGQVVPRQVLVKTVYREEYDSLDKYQERRLNSLVRRLREKIEPIPGKPRYIHSVRGQGYRLETGKKDTG